MAPTSDDLDLTQAQAFALEPRDLAELLGTVEASLQASTRVLQVTRDAAGLHRCLHDLKGYLGLVATPDLCGVVREADNAARSGQLALCHAHVVEIMPRLQALLTAVQTYRAGIIVG